MSIKSENLPAVLQQARTSVYNMGVVCDLLQRLCAENREIHNELVNMAKRLKIQLERNKQLKKALAASEKERLVQVEQTDSVIGEEDGKMSALHERLNQQRIASEKAAQQIRDEQAKIKELQTTKKIQQEEISALQQNILHATQDQQQKEAESAVKINDQKNQREGLQDVIARLRTTIKTLEMQVNQSKGDRIKLEELERKLQLEAVNNDGIKRILRGGYEIKSDIKF